MEEKSLNNLIRFYDEYVELSWSKDFHLNFWKIKLDEVAKNLTEEEIESFQNEPHFFSEGIFGTYDIGNGNSTGWLNTRSEVKSITRDSINSDKNAFLQEIINLSIVRYQNALVTLLIQAINECYVKINQFDVCNRTCLNKFFHSLSLRREENDKHLLTFLESKSNLVKEFLDTNCNIDLNANWRDLFEFYGIIRNTIVHNGMLMSWDKYKTYLTVENDIFHYFFEKPEKAKLFLLKPRLDRIGLFANYSDQLATNIIRRLADKPDLTFLRFSPV